MKSQMKCIIMYAQESEVVMSQLKIENLHVSVADKEILKGLNLEVNENEIHALMGPNGNGKSTLLAAIMGNPKYVVTKGSITFNGQDVLKMSVDERSRVGLFLGMQYPQEIAGVTNSDFLRAALNARLETPMPLFKFIKEIESTIHKLQMKPEMCIRDSLQSCHSTVRQELHRP